MLNLGLEEEANSERRGDCIWGEGGLQHRRVMNANMRLSAMFPPEH